MQSDLPNFIKGELLKGIAWEVIKTQLLAKGWGEQILNDTYRQLLDQQNINQAPSPQNNKRIYPSISIERIQNPSRIYAIPILGGLIKAFILIPVAIILYVLSLVIFFLLPINAMVVLFTGKYWSVLYNLVSESIKISAKTYFFAMGLTNKYPGFNSTIEDFSIEVQYPEYSNRFFAVPFIKK